MSLVPFVHVDTSLDGARAGDEVPLAPHDVHHLTTVLRLEPGAAVEVADGRGGSAGAEVAGGALRLSTDVTHGGRPVPRIEVAQALPKGRKLDEVVRQLTELDVDGIIPVVTQRCVVRLTGPKADRAVTRWTAVARAACEQARRSHRPRIAQITPLSGLAEAVEQDATEVLVAQPGAPGLPHHLEACRGAQRVVVLVGPEGGLGDTELADLDTLGARRVGLGATTLRTEHAAAAAVAALAAGLGRWG